MVGGGHNLRPFVLATEVHLVPVVARRVVARGHHDTSTEVQFAQRCRNDGSGDDVVKQHDLESHAGENLGRISGKNVRIDASVVSDDDAGPFFA